MTAAAPVTRHFLDVGGRRVHYRRCGRGPLLLMGHQSPRSSVEMVPLMRRWAAHFTCVAPDSPGFGLSEPLPGGAAITIDDLAEAVLAIIDALGQGPVVAYGIHSGGVIQLAALRRRPSAFRALAVTGYGMHRPEEQAIFSDAYLPPFQPSAYGEHLTWLWQRSIEQAWFFPWYVARRANRFPYLHTDVDKAAESVLQMLESGDAYRTGYGAVLRSPRIMPPVDAVFPPVRFSTYAGDPLESHLDRLGALPAGWDTHRAPTQEADAEASRAFLQRHAGPGVADLPEAPDEGFIPIDTAAFTGLIHWRGERGGPLHLHAPGRALELLEPADGLAIDLPGHGVSDPWPGPPPRDRAAWQTVIDAAAKALDAGPVVPEPMPAGDPARLFPDLTPDRFGAYLTQAWGIARAQQIFDLWYEPSAETMRDVDPADLDPERLARIHRALIRASATGAARAYAEALAG